MIQKIIYILKLFRYLSFKKLFNYFSLYFSYKISKKKPVFSVRLQPSFISVEPSNVCQLQCPECPVGQRFKQNISAVNLDENVYRKTIDELKSTLLHVIFYFQGEPLLNKKISDYIQYAHKANIFTSTSTNAQALNNEVAKKIVESGLDKLIVSIDGSTQEVYEKYRVGGKLTKAMEGVESVVRWKEKLKSPTPFIEIQCVIFKTNEHQMLEMKKLSKTLKADRIVFKTAQLYDFENGHELLTTLDKYARYKKDRNGKYHIKSKLPNRCMRLWTGAVVNSKGDLVPCCFDKNSENSFGSIVDQSFSATWHNEKATKFRTSILQNRKQYDMCRNCTSK